MFLLSLEEKRVDEALMSHAKDEPTRIMIRWALDIGDYECKELQKLGSPEVIDNLAEKSLGIFSLLGAERNQARYRGAIIRLESQWWHSMAGR